MANLAWLAVACLPILVLGLLPFLCTDEVADGCDASAARARSRSLQTEPQAEGGGRTGESKQWEWHTESFRGAAVPTRADSIDVLKPFWLIIL